MHKVHEQVRHDSTLQLRQLAAALLGIVIVYLTAASALAEEALAEEKAPFGPWQAPLLRDHPLTGRILDASTLAPITRKALEKRLRASDIAILGEVHDNPDHHRIQAQLLAAFAQGRRRPPAVVFEMIPTDMQQRLDMILKLPEVDADMIFDAVRWDESGWPSRDLYRPIMKQALRLRAPIIAAGLPRKDIRPVSRNGLDAALSKEEQRAMQLAPLPPALMDALTREIVKSHCDMIPEEVARRMGAVQRLRDALLARGVREGYRRQGSAVLITGNGHARKDRATPLYLRRYGDVPAPFVVWQAEVQKNAERPEDVLPDDAGPDALADAIIITPRAQREDPCRQFARFMQRRNNRRK